MDPLSMLGTVGSFLGGGGSGVANTAMPDQITVTPTAGSGAFVVGRGGDSPLLSVVLLVVIGLLLRR
jgi:hypothetical protein